MSELEDAVQLANRVLDKPYIDPDGDICMLARQFLRALEREREAELRGQEAERTLISAQIDTTIKQEREKLDQELYGFSEAIAVLARNADKPELTIVAVRRLYAELSRRIRDAECPEATALRAELAQRRAKETQTP